MKAKHQRSAGITLIELMIVLAIVAILVALAVPAYQAYAIRAKVTECIAAAAVPKLNISEFYQSYGRWPGNAAEAGIDSSFQAFFTGNLSKYCRIFFYNNGQGDFAVWVNSEALSPKLADVQIIPVLSPVGANDRNWRCTFGFTDSEAMKYLPSTCRAENIY